MNGKKWLVLLVALTVLLCLFSPAALADGAEDEGAREKAPVVNPEGETLINAGDTVYNNGGVVYNNGGVVFNNGGVVYNNGGTTYNNAGTAYNNAGTVYNNAGTVFENGGVTHNNDGVQEAPGRFAVTMAGDYAQFSKFDGLTKEKGVYYISAGESCTVSPAEGYRISRASASAGELTENQDGSYTLSAVEAPVDMTLAFVLAAPQFSPAAGSCLEGTAVEISAAAEAEIYYTLNGDTPTQESTLYKEPIELTEGVILSAIAVCQGAEPSAVSIAQYAVPRLTAPEFKNEAAGYKQPKAKGIAIDNRGLAEAVIQGVTLEGEGAESFILSSAEGKTLEPGVLDDSSWTLRPAADLEPGAYSAKIVVTLDSGDELTAFVSFKVT